MESFRIVFAQQWRHPASGILLAESCVKPGAFLHAR
jgi:hypothetical protein